MIDIISSDTKSLSYQELVDSLNRLLRIRTTPIGMKMYEHAADMEAIPRIRRPQAIHTTESVV